MINSTIYFTIKIKSVSTKIAIFGLQKMVKSGLDPSIKMNDLLLQNYISTVVIR